MNPLRPADIVLTDRLCRIGLTVGVIILKAGNQVGACAEPLQAMPRQAANQRQTVARCLALAIFLTALGSGCSTNGLYADGINHWPVQTISVDSGSN